MANDWQVKENNKQRIRSKELCKTVSYGYSKLGHKGEGLFYLALLGGQEIQIVKGEISV